MYHKSGLKRPAVPVSVVNPPNASNVLKTRLQIKFNPPYNTGNEEWVYNDNVNDPRIKKWLGEVVGKEGEDLSRHDKWLCMMYPGFGCCRNCWQRMGLFSFPLMIMNRLVCKKFVMKSLAFRIL